MEPPTYNVTRTSLGLRLDSAIQQLDSLSSTQLYVLIVSLTIFVSFLVLGSSSHHEVPTMQFSERSRKPTKDGPEPRWHIFRWVNFAAVALLSWSVADFSANATIYLNDSDSSTVLKFLLGWSVLLCYFFGFFGISFVHDMTDEQEEESGNQK